MIVQGDLPREVTLSRHYSFKVERFLNFISEDAVQRYMADLTNFTWTDIVLESTEMAQWA